MSSPKGGATGGLEASGSSAANDVPSVINLKKPDLIQRIIGHPVNELNKVSLGKLKKDALLEHWYAIDGRPSPPPPPPPTTKLVTDIVVVKCGLRNVMNLNDAEYATFNGIVEQYVQIISRMLRRASLVLLYSLTRLAMENKRIPHLFDQKDTFWKNWLKGLPYEAKTTGEVARRYEGNSADIGATRLYFPDVASVDCPPGFDQVVNYAGHTFRTVVCNNAYVPLLPRLTRLTKLFTRSRTKEETGGLKVYDVLYQIRSSEPDFAGWSPCFEEYAKDVRRRLFLQPGDYLFDDYGKTLDFHDLFMFNYWMQGQLKVLGGRRIALSPVFKVDRKHVRLDTKTLVSMATRAFPKGAKDVLDHLSSLETEHMKETKDGGYGFADPRKCLLPPSLPKKLKKDCNSEEWEAQAKAGKEEQAKQDTIKASPAFVGQASKYKQLQDAKVAVCRVLFKDLPLKKDWEFDGSINTDGVSVSLQFSRVREVIVTKKTKKAKEAKVVTKATKANKATSSERAVEEDEGGAYDRNLLTVFNNLEGKQTVVAGVDPGRVNMAVIAIVTMDESGKIVKKTWALGRSQYRADSGIKKQDALKKARFKGLEERWEGLGADGGALRTDDIEDVKTYLEKYAKIETEWWSLASMRRESRADFQRYIGKRKVLDGFFSRVRQELKSKFPGAFIKVGYGSAGMKMKPTGRGEVAVPTTGTFKACVRVFGHENVSSTNEHKTTAVEYESGQRKEAVYRVVTKDAATGRFKESMGHTTDMKKMPVVKAAHVEAATEHLEVGRQKARRRRGATEIGLEVEHTNKEVEGHTDRTLRYPEIRGLRFSPERRIYLDRDREAASTIARLRTIELLGRPRPTPFCWGRARVG
jgi:hypothetical protein